MTPSELRDWRREMHFSRAAASKALGLSERSLAYYEAGERDGRKQDIPLWLALACAALHRSIPPWPDK